MQTFIISFLCSVLLAIVACAIPTRLKNGGKLFIIAIAFLITNILFLLTTLEFGILKSGAILLVLFLLTTFLLNRKFSDEFYHSASENNEYISQFSAKDMQKEQSDSFVDKKYRSQYFRSLKEDIKEEGHFAKGDQKEENIDWQNNSTSFATDEFLINLEDELINEPLKQEEGKIEIIQEQNNEEDFQKWDVGGIYLGKDWASELESTFNDDKIIQRETSVETLIDESLDYQVKERDNVAGDFLQVDYFHIPRNEANELGEGFIHTKHSSETNINNPLNDDPINNSRIVTDNKTDYRLELFLADMEEDPDKVIEKETSKL